MLFICVVQMDDCCRIVGLLCCSFVLCRWMTVAIVRNCWTFMLTIYVVQMDDYCHSVGLLSCANRAARKHMDCLISTLGKVTLLS